MIKAILFDFDGVLTVEKTGSISITKYLAEKTGVNIKQMTSCYRKYNHELLYGSLTHEDMWDDFCDDIGKKVDYQLLIESFWKTPLDEEMFSLVRRLKQQYRIGMVTDNKCDRIHEILKYHQLEDVFDTVIVSAEYGIGKDSEQLFWKAVQALEVKPSQCIFVDNTARNLAAPEKMGMKTIFFDDEKRDVEAFERILLELLDET